VRLASDGAPRDPHVYWCLGLGGVLPAWLIAFLTLLDESPGTRPALASVAGWMLSVAAGLAGAIAGGAVIRREAESPEGLSPVRGWRVGVWSGTPAWAVALLGHILRLLA
jgi:hypothetical protein